MKYPYAVPAELARQPWWPTARDLSFDAVLKRLGERDKLAARALLMDFLDLFQIPAAASDAKIDKVLTTTTLGDWSKAWKPLKGLTAFGRLESLRGAMAQLDHLFGDAPPAPPAATLSGPLRAMQLRVLIDRVRSEGVLPPYSAYHLATALGPTVTVGEAYDSATCTIEVRGFIEAMDRRLNDGVATGAEARAARLARWQREAPARGGEALLALQAQLAATEMPLDEATRARLHSTWMRTTDRYEVELAGAFTCLTSSCRHVDIMFTGDAPVVRCERGTLPCRAKLAAVNNALDTLMRDDERGHALRDHLRQPAWQRMLDRLRLAAVGPVDKRKVGWVLKLPNELALCWLEPKKSGGLKASKLTRADLMDYEPERHEDLLALQLYRSAAQHWDADSLAHVLSTFTSRDGLYARSDLGIIPVRVRVAEPRVEVVPAPGGSRVVVRIGDSSAEVSPPYRTSWTMTIDPEEGLVYLAFWTRATRIAWEALNSNTTIPAEATGPLTDTLLGLGSRVAVKKDASWLGRPFEPDSKVSFRLGFEGPRGARQLAIEGRVQPVAELGALVPGVGEALIPVRREGEVGHVARDFSRELELVSDAAQSVGLGADEGDATWRVKGLDEAMAIWNALTLAAANDPTLEVVWANKTPSVQRSRGVDKLALRLAVKRDWLDVRGGFQLEGGELPIAELLDALRDKKRFIEVDDGRVLEIGEALSKELAPLSALVRDNDGGIRTSVLAAPIIAELAKLGATIEGPPEWLNASKRLTEAASLEVPLPAAIDAVLRPYQLEGLTWAARLAHWARGACLADEMGLGKTLQALALIAHRRAVGPVLVVAPTSVVPNWLREARRFAPSLDARAIVSGAAIDVLDGLTTKNTPLSAPSRSS